MLATRTEMKYGGLAVPEEHTPKKTVRTEHLAPFQEAFAEYLRRCAETRGHYPYVYQLSKELFKFVFTPEEIQEVLDSTLRLAPFAMMRGFVLSDLIQQSYNAGHSHFHITTTQSIDYLGYELRGSPDRALHLTLHGNASHQAFQEAAYINVLVSGNAGDRIGRLSDHSIIEIQGDATTYTAEYAKNCTFRLRKSFETMGSKTDNCSIQAYRRSTYNKLLKEYLPDSTIQLFDDQNKLLEERKRSASF